MLVHSLNRKLVEYRYAVIPAAFYLRRHIIGEAGACLVDIGGVGVVSGVAGKEPQGGKEINLGRRVLLAQLFYAIINEILFQSNHKNL